MCGMRAAAGLLGALAQLTWNTLLPLPWREGVRVLKMVTPEQ